MKISQQLLQLNFTIVEGNVLSKIFGLVDTGAKLYLVTLEYNQSMMDINANFVVKLAYLKDLEGVDPFNISVVDIVK